jgi:hypothetical protein
MHEENARRRKRPDMTIDPEEAIPRFKWPDGKRNQIL